MAYSNAELVRREVGDRGLVARDTDSGDGVATEYWLSTPPVMAGSQIVKVGGTTYSEVASAPGANQYTLDDETGRLIFGVAPAVGTDNIEAVYRTGEITDGDVEEALHQRGLVAATAADVGPAAALLEAAALLADWQAAAHAGDVNSKIDGQDIDRSKIFDRWTARAAAIRARLEDLLVSTGVAGAIVSAPITRVDAYSDDLSSRDVGVTTQNPRRKYYGAVDKIP
jgi:hypothetical protein